MKRDFTATCYVIHEEKVLLIFHKKFKKWLPPGGHVDENETPPEAAKREVLEETGVEIEFIPCENITVTTQNAKSIERPYMCVLEEVPAYGEIPAHQHVDFIYVGYPVGGKMGMNVQEVDAMRYFTKEEVMALQNIFPDTQETIVHLLESELIKSPHLIY